MKSTSRAARQHFALPAVLLGLAACGGSAPPATSAPQPTTAANPPAKDAPAKEAGPSYGTKVSDTPAPADLSARLAWAMAGAQRTEKERARDKYRHPKETLEFFGLKEGMTVVEISPGGGWYTAILAPTLRDHGKLIVTGVDPATAKGEGRENQLAFEKRLKDAPGIYDQVQIQRVAPPNTVVLGPEGSADLVLTFRNVHGFIHGGYTEKLFGEAFKVLKHGGTFGVVEHRANPGSDPQKAPDTGYVPEEYVVKVAEAAGFKLAAKSEVNANPKDTHDHPGGVWALPPNLKNGDKDRDAMLAIGESDRMTMKFVKP